MGVGNDIIYMDSIDYIIEVFMLFFGDKKKKVRKFVDEFVKEYQHLRSIGYCCEDAISEIYTRYSHEDSESWRSQSLMDQITKWHSLSSSIQMPKAKSSGKENDRIVDGVRGTLPVACDIRTRELEEYTCEAEDYLMHRYHIGDQKKVREDRQLRKTATHEF